MGNVNTMILFILLGLISGLLGGLLGIGGGVVTVPALFFLFTYMGLGGDHVMQVAVATSLAGAVVTSAISTFVQWKRKAILFSVLKLMFFALVIGCVTGSFLAHFVSSNLLTEIFGGMATLLGFYFFFPRLPYPSIRPNPDWSLSFFAFLIGSLSSLLGIGGGAITFPVLMGYHVPIKNCSATSSASTLISTIIGSLSYLLIAWNKAEIPHAFGYIEVPAFIWISLGSAISAPLGVYLSHVLNVGLMKRIFGVCLSLVGLSLFFF